MFWYQTFCRTSSRPSGDLASLKQPLVQHHLQVLLHHCCDINDLNGNLWLFFDTVHRCSRHHLFRAILDTGRPWPAPRLFATHVNVRRAFRAHQNWLWLRDCGIDFRKSALCSLPP